MSFNAFKVIDVFCKFFSTRKAATKLNFAVLLSNTMGKQIPENMRKLIIKLSTENKSYADISKITGIPRSTVGRIVKTFKSTGRKVARLKTGRSPISKFGPTLELCRVTVLFYPGRNNCQSLFVDSQEGEFCYFIQGIPHEILTLAFVYVRFVKNTVFVL